MARIGNKVLWPALMLTAVTLVVVPARGQAQAMTPESAGDVDALVSYEVRSITGNGVLRRELWQDRLVRRGDRLWIERQFPAKLPVTDGERAAMVPPKRLPAASAVASAVVDAAGHGDDGQGATHIGHKWFNYDRAARWIDRQADGKLRLRYVDPQRRLVVDVPAAEFSTVGFTASWEANAHLIAPAVIRAKRDQAKRAAAPAVDGWLIDATPGWSHRVRWSDRLQMPSRIESASDDGRVQRVVTVTALPLTPNPQLPWLLLGGYESRQYDDFTD